MEPVKKVSDALSIAGQPTPEDLEQAAAQGFKSVLNLRSPSEANTLPDEQQHAEAAGLRYATVPLSPSSPDDALVHQALEELENLPQPVLLHCGAGARAGGLALIATAMQENLTKDQLIDRAQQIGISLDQPHLKQFLATHYGKDASG